MFLYSFSRDAEALRSGARSLANRAPLRKASASRLNKAVIVALVVALNCAGAEPERFAAIDAAVEKSIAAGEMPGCVVLVLHKDAVVCRKAFGLRAKLPAEEK